MELLIKTSESEAVVASCWNYTCLVCNAALTAFFGLILFRCRIWGKQLIILCFAILVIKGFKKNKQTKKKAFVFQKGTQEQSQTSVSIAANPAAC